jgi:hypothetical protein
LLLRIIWGRVVGAALVRAVSRTGLAGAAIEILSVMIVSVVVGTSVVPVVARFVTPARIIASAVIVGIIVVIPGPGGFSDVDGCSGVVGLIPVITGTGTAGKQCRNSQGETKGRQTAIGDSHTFIKA